jgi:porin
MKKTLAALVAFLPAVASQATEDRFWDYYTPVPSNFIGSEEWWNGDAATGDWWGTRNWMDKEKGVEFSSSYVVNLAGNPSGGLRQGFTYTDNIAFGAKLDLEKLVGWRGAVFTIAATDRNGNSLSQDYIGNQFTVQQVYGGQTIILTDLHLVQKFWDDKAQIKAGRFSAGDDFASSPLYWLYMNNGIDGNPQALPVNTAFTSYPASVWGARLRVDPSPEWFAMGGIYQATSLNLYRDHGLDWSINNSDGVLMIGQVGWTPEFFKKPAAAPKPSDGKSLAEGKTVRPVSPDADMQGLPAHYWFGAY